MNTKDEIILESFDAERNTIYAIAYSHKIPYDEIEDILLETFTRLLEKYPKIESPEEIHLLVVTIATNLCMDYYRQKYRHPTDYLDPENLETDVWDALPGSRRWEYEPEDASMGGQLEESLLNGIRALKPIYYQIFILMVIQDRSAQEVSQMLGITVENCRERLYRANKMLEEYLEEHCDVWIKRKKQKKKPPSRLNPEWGKQ